MTQDHTPDRNDDYDDDHQQEIRQGIRDLEEKLNSHHPSISSLELRSDLLKLRLQLTPGSHLERVFGKDLALLERQFASRFETNESQEQQVLDDDNRSHQSEDDMEEIEELTRAMKRNMLRMGDIIRGDHQEIERAQQAQSMSSLATERANRLNHAPKIQIGWIEMVKQGAIALVLFLIVAWIL